MHSRELLTMPERSVRFGVADSENRRAASWKCFGGGRKEVYVACRALAGCIKLSLHESGRWHVAFDYQKFPTLFEPGSAPPTRFSAVWKRPAPIVQGFTLACRIHTPWYAANIQEQELEAGVTWLAPASAGQSVEVAIFLCDQLIDPNAWPGRTSMQTQPVGWFELDGGGCVWVVCTAVCPPSSRSYHQCPRPSTSTGRMKPTFLHQARGRSLGARTRTGRLFSKRALSLSRRM
jgi:hypothetical protein